MATNGPTAAAATSSTGATAMGSHHLLLLLLLVSLHTMLLDRTAPALAVQGHVGVG